MTGSDNTAQLRKMMAAYEGPQHSVVGMQLHEGRVQYLMVQPPLIQPTPAPIAPEALLFEIGSITKVFTAILLCHLVEEGMVDPQAPLREMAPELAEVPDWITAERLSAHTSGLPRIHVPLWKALLRPLPADPYATFSRGDLLDWLHRWRHAPACKAPRKLRHGYSNLGVGLLGEALALRTGQPYLALLQDRLLNPLGLTDTGVKLSADQQRRFQQPRRPRGKPVPPWTFQAIAAAGCLRSTADDLARFAAAVINAHSAPDTPLDRAICRASQPVFGLGPKGNTTPVAQCSGWLQLQLDPTRPGYLFHDGATAGSTAALYICPEAGKACAILSNNGIAASLWQGLKLEGSNQRKQAAELFASLQ